MIKIDFPPYKPRLKKEKDKEFIFDPIRKRWVILTPEEWVRQNFLQYLIIIKKYPASLIAVEKEVIMGDLKKRFDIVVYAQDTTPQMLIECKEMNVDLSSKVLDQVLRYNSVLRVPYLVITNGSYSRAFKCAANEFRELAAIP